MFKYKNIIFIYPGMANYPEISAYRKFFEKKYNISVFHKKELQQRNFDKNTVLWFIMGFYPEKYNAGFIIHDYRSLSTGFFPRFKDKLKKYFNDKPNLRIFLNRDVAKQMRFNDGVPELFIDMGVPDEIEKYSIKNKASNEGLTYQYDFVYVGEVSKERKAHKMISNFLKRYNLNKKFLLIGSADLSIIKKFKKYSNIFFTGWLPQKKVFEFIEKAEVCVNFIPNKYPYYFQTSTKFLEYAALNKKIISSDLKSNRMLAEKYKINTFFVLDYNFPEENEIKKIKPNTDIILSEIKWSTIIGNSGITEYL